MDTRDISPDVALASLVSGSPLTDRFLDNLKIPAHHTTISQNPLLLVNPAIQFAGLIEQ